MNTYVIEREVPGASKLTDEELRGITSTSNDAVETLNKPYEWLHSYVADDKIYAGVGKTRFAEDVLEAADARFATDTAQHPQQAALPVAHRGRHQGRGARAPGVTGRLSAGGGASSSSASASPRSRSSAPRAAPCAPCR